MKIMHISTRLILGGSQENTVLSCAGQSDHGHEVSLVYGPIHGPEGSMLADVQTHGNIKTIETPNLIRELNPLRDLRCRGDLRAIIRAEQPDVVHTHSSKAGILGRAAAWKEEVPAVVHTIHGLPFHPYQSHVAQTIYIQSERWAAKRCHRIVCVADAMREQALAAGVGHPELFTTIRSGMKTAPFLNAHADFDRDAVRKSFGFAPDDFVLGTVARLAELKGHDDLLDAVAPTIANEKHLRLLWVGDGFKRERLLARARELQLEDRLVTTGHVPPERIPELLIAMDLLVHPSYREGLPRAVPQALLSGTPAIAYDVDGTREVIEDGVTGLLVAPGDINALRQAINRMQNDSALRKATATEGQNRCAEQFSAAKMVEQLEALYATLLA